MTGTERLTEYAGELPLFPSDPCNRERGRKNERRGKWNGRTNEMRMNDKGKKKLGIELKRKTDEVRIRKIKRQIQGKRKDKENQMRKKENKGGNEEIKEKDH